MSESEQLEAALAASLMESGDAAPSSSAASVSTPMAPVAASAVEQSPGKYRNETR
jgi:hypothetical protein